jgi:glycosyltransferase involved in cell wall biosynthesis
MVSVCLATYNGEKYIKEQLDSILIQLDKNDEIIISDDVSIDNTINIIH